MVNVNAIVKSIVHAKKDYNWNPSTCICENLKGVVNICDDQQ